MTGADPLDELQRRFTWRLSTALDTRGVPTRALDRARALASLLGVDISVANAIASGAVMPDLAQLVRLSESLQRPVGYFLDERAEALPPGTAVIRPIASGEDLVLRLPSYEISTAEIARGLAYYCAPTALGFGFEPGDYLISFEPGAQIDAVPGSLYLFDADEGIEVRECIELASGRAVFQNQAVDPVPLIIPTAISPAAGMRFGRIVASMRCGKSVKKQHP